MWKFRNETHHGKPKKEQNDNTLHRLNTQVKLLYRKASYLKKYNRDEIKYVFKQSLFTKLQQSAGALNAWVVLAKGVLATAEEKSNNKIDTWLNRETNYQDQLQAGDFTENETLS